MSKRQFNSNDFEIMKNGRDREADNRLLNWFKREKEKSNPDNKVEWVQGCDGVFRRKIGGRFID